MKTKNILILLAFSIVCSTIGGLMQILHSSSLIFRNLMHTVGFVTFWLVIIIAIVNIFKNKRIVKEA